MLPETVELDATAEEDLRRQYHELAELAGSLAHEIKNPLSVIHMNADLLSEELTESEWPGRRRAEAKVDMIRQQCQRMENLLRDFLRFSRMRDLEMTPGSLNEQVETVLMLFKPQADKFGVEVIRYLDNDLPSVLLHSDSLQAALINLVKNALEAMPDGGQLVVRTYTTPRGVALDLIDTVVAWTIQLRSRCSNRSIQRNMADRDWDCPPRERLSKHMAVGSAFKAKLAAEPNSCSNSLFQLDYNEARTESHQRDWHRNLSRTVRIPWSIARFARVC